MSFEWVAEAPAEDDCVSKLLEHHQSLGFCPF